MEKNDLVRQNDNFFIKNRKLEKHWKHSVTASQQSQQYSASSGGYFGIETVGEGRETTIAKHQQIY